MNARRRAKRRLRRQAFRDWLATWLIGDEPIDITGALSRLDILDGRRLPDPVDATAPRA